MAFGVTSTGFLRKTFEDILSEVEASELSQISPTLDLSERTVLGNLNAIFADHLAQAWEYEEDAYHAFDVDNAADDRLAALGLLLGVVRLGATKGLITATVNLDASQSYAPGDLIAHVSGETTNRWVNRDTVTSTTAGNYPAIFESESAGADAVAGAGTLTVIAQTVAGWNSITNAGAATPGTDQETPEALRIRIQAAVAVTGSGTVPAILADVSAVTGVVAAGVTEDTTNHTITVTIWDGSTPAAANNDVAAAIGDSKPAGIGTVGATSGTDSYGNTQNFNRATEVPIYIDVQIESAEGVAIADVKAAIVEKFETDRTIGTDVIYNALAASVFAVDGVDDWALFEIGTSPSPSGTADIPISSTQFATLDPADITVTGDAS